jgi:hypothetical protein
MASIAASRGSLNARSRPVRTRKSCLFAGILRMSPTSSTAVEKARRQSVFSGENSLSAGPFSCVPSLSQLWKSLWPGRSLILARPLAEGLRLLLSFSREAHLSAQRSSAEAPARLPGTDVNPGRPRDPEAAQSPRAEASLRLSFRSTCSAATASPGRVISMRCTGKAGPSPRAFSFSTALTARGTRAARRDSESRCRRRSVAP